MSGENVAIVLALVLLICMLVEKKFWDRAVLTLGKRTFIECKTMCFWVAFEAPTLNFEMCLKQWLFLLELGQIQSI